MEKPPKQSGAVTASEQVGGNPDDSQEELVDLNFRVPKSFRKMFKQAALDHERRANRLTRSCVVPRTAGHPPGGDDSLDH